NDRSAVVVEPDRRRAIERAMSEARAGDVVLVAGKGHEAVIELAGRSVPFDDRIEAAAAARAWAGRR
ncbi:MAG: UDP-N-acetylmuramoyl-L-alanyl-D-glutamate--2,6-diaminopimelate ligase, partial [Acidimicrobiales bacterium]